jgi:hypothetical protein
MISLRQVQMLNYVLAVLRYKLNIEQILLHGTVKVYARKPS